MFTGGAYDKDGGSITGVSSTGRTAGPHKSDMLNKLDPRVDSDLSKQQGSHGGDHHYGRDAAMTGAGGAALYETEKHHQDNESNLAKSSTSSGMASQSPYGSGSDPRVDSTRSGTVRDEPGVSSAGSGHQPATSSSHHYKRDAGLAGAGGIGAYEAEKHLGSSNRSDPAASPQDQLAGSGHQPVTGTSPSAYGSTSYGTGSQPQTGQLAERDSLAAGGVGPEATGVDKTQNMRDYGRTDPGIRVQEHQNQGGLNATYPSSGYGNETEKGHQSGHHTGRDAALVGGVGAGAGALAGHEYSQKDASKGHHVSKEGAVAGGHGAGFGYGDEPYQEASRKHHTGRENAAVGGAGAGAGALAGREYPKRDAGYGTEPYQDTSRDHHTGRDTAILGGAAGAGGLAEHEHSKKDAEKLQKEHVKEEKALEKEHLKEVKNHNKELAKEEKMHEKAIEKSEKKHEKALEKDEKKQGEKKHGGLLGFLHRDKKDSKEEEAHDQGGTPAGRGQKEGPTGLESRGSYDPLQGEHGSQSGVHDTPSGIGSGPTTHDAYGAHDSGHNKLHKDPPAKVLESRGFGGSQ